MNYLKSGVKSSDKAHLQMEMARPLTPLSERRRHSYGSMLVSVQTVDGLCTETSKCFRRDGHEGTCYPQ